jgi:hypothetical protein
LDEQSRVHCSGNAVHGAEQERADSGGAHGAGEYGEVEARSRAHDFAHRTIRPAQTARRMIGAMSGLVRSAIMGAALAWR